MPHFEIIRNQSGDIADITATINNRKIKLLGTAGPPREVQQVQNFLEHPRGIPVFLGLGLGYALKAVLASYPGPVVILDKEKSLQEITGVLNQLTPQQRKQITLISASDVSQALDEFRVWQHHHNHQHLYPICLSFYQRIEPAWYGYLHKAIQSSSQFWEKARSPRFARTPPRILLLTHKYFLIGELKTACEKLGLTYKLVMISEKEADTEEFVKTLLKEAAEFQPDCCITLNHMGVDMEGVLMYWLDRLELPLASWFVDNPHLIIHLYKNCQSPWLTIFTWDQDNLPTLQEAGFAHVYYLPLGTDPERFRPNAGKPNPDWKARVSFVGNSMIHKVGARLKAMRFPKELLRTFAPIAKAFADSEQRSVTQFMANKFPESYTAFQRLPDTDKKLAWETAITWKATQIYRNERVKRLLPFEPLIVGDDGWHIVFRHARPKPRILPPINYYDQLPIFYGESQINFNCTSRQMKGAVNQRVFDAPAAGGFVLTDWRPQMAGLFEPDEMACYHDMEEIPQLTEYYLTHPEIRHAIVAKARQRILSCHTWADRLKSLLQTMADIYGLKLKA